MKNKLFIGWIAGIPLLVVVLIIIIVMHEPEKDGISRALAAKAAALSMTDRTECEKKQTELGKSHYSAKDKDLWYVKYMDYLYEEELLTEEMTKPDDKTAGEWITYGEVEQMAAAVSDDLKSSVKATKKNRSQPIPEDAWWEFYSDMVAITDKDSEVKEINIIIYGTPLNVEDSKSWVAYTDQGDWGFEGLGMDSFIDHELKVIVRNGEIITVKEVVSDTVVIKNVWLADGGGNQFLVYMGSIQREMEFKSREKMEGLIGNIADIHLKKGKLVKIVVKKEKITGKVLSVKQDSIEIEGYGEVKLEPGFQVFKTYGSFQKKKLSDILVGYDLQEFVVDGGGLCAALIERDFDAKTVRVLLMSTGYQDIFHPELVIQADSPVTLRYGKDKQEVIEAGQKLTIAPGDERLKDGRLILEAQADMDIRVKSIDRAQGNPAYEGRLEITQEDKGLVLVNELFLEDYLTKVVPSEMPSSYEKEALKAQAVCARTYAYRQIQSNGYSRYGAHIDDSTNYQVYNNIVSDPRTDAAVQETYGKIILYQGTPIEAFYFSTSCGTTTDGGVWGSDPDLVPYLKSVALRDSRETLKLTDNDAFDKFIKNKDYKAYDSEFQLYRWETSLTSEQLGAKVSGIGTIESAKITERGPGGNAKKMEVKGSEGTKEITGQHQIRSALGTTSQEIIKKNGDKMQGFDILPSGFITIEAKGKDDKGSTVFKIYGGGYGHGAGMSQNGAQGMAKAGKKYEEILTFFYDGVEVTEIGSE